MEKLQLKKAADAFAKANDYWTSNKSTFQHIGDSFMAGAAYAAQEVADKDAEIKRLAEALAETRSKLINAFGLFGGGQRLNEIFDYLNNLLEPIAGKEAGQDV